MIPFQAHFTYQSLKFGKKYVAIKVIINNDE
jgi:hypothetical protein